jgi:hypothetical protein
VNGIDNENTAKKTQRKENALLAQEYIDHADRRASRRRLLGNIR